tara:strand:+ start:68 stop:394 length:327 start_codon:yes stop_codon:yes gene_type:complete
MRGYITLILSSLFFVCYSQVSVIHFNSSWNAENSIDISELKDCKKKNVLICHNEDLKDKYNIKSVPTIVILDEGAEVTRFEANIMMQLEATKKDIQREIDKIYLAKFE